MYPLQIKQASILLILLTEWDALIYAIHYLCKQLAKRMISLSVCKA